MDLAVVGVATEVVVAIDRIHDEAFQALVATRRPT